MLLERFGDRACKLWMDGARESESRGSNSGRLPRDWRASFGFVGCAGLLASFGRPYNGCPRLCLRLEKIKEDMESDRLDDV